MILFENPDVSFENTEIRNLNETFNITENEIKNTFIPFDKINNEKLENIKSNKKDEDFQDLMSHNLLHHLYIQSIYFPTILNFMKILKPENLKIIKFEDLLTIKTEKWKVLSKNTQNYFTVLIIFLTM